MRSTLKRMAHSVADDGRSGATFAEVAHDFDQNRDRHRRGERDNEGEGVVVLEGLATDVPQQRRVGGPDDCCRTNPLRKPAAGLAGDSA